MTAPARGIQLDFWASPEVVAEVPTRVSRVADLQVVRRTAGDHSTNASRMAHTADPHHSSAGAGRQSVVDMPERPGRSATEAMALPNWVPHGAWAAYAEMRNRMGVPLSERSTARVIRSLMKLREAGHDPTAVLNQSVVRRARSVSAVTSLSLPVVGDFPMSDPS